MKIVYGDLWHYPADIRVITTNGMVKRNGECVMGAGCALQAKNFFPRLSYHLGALINERGNHVHDLGKWGGFDSRLVSFPVKHLWMQRADLALIEQSCQELVAHAANFAHTVRYVIPRPGCGNGDRTWEEVAPILERYFDDRFHIIDFKKRS